MTSRQLLVMPLAFCLSGGHVLAEEVQEIDICEVVRSPEDYDGKFIRTPAYLRTFENGELNIGHRCPGDVLLVTPDEVTPRPDFILSEDIDWTFVFDGEIRRVPVFSMLIDGQIRRVPGFSMLIDGQIRRVPGFIWNATLEGRIDWIGVDLPPFPLKYIRKIQGRIDWKRLRTKTGEPVTRKDLFGEVKVPVRLVLRRVSNVALVRDLVQRH